MVASRHPSRLRPPGLRVTSGPGPTVERGAQSSAWVVAPGLVHVTSQRATEVSSGACFVAGQRCADFSVSVQSPTSRARIDALASGRVLDEALRHRA